MLDIFQTIPETQLSSLKELVATSQFGFDWSTKSSVNAQTVGVLHQGEIIGLVEFERRPVELANYMFLLEVARAYRGGSVAGRLLAYVAKDSLVQGFGGFFFFEAKDALIQYYIDRFGAKVARNRTLFFDEQAAQALVHEFLERV